MNRIGHKVFVSRSRTARILLSVVAAVSTAALVRAQAPAPPPPPPLVRNGDFEQTIVKQNIWEGVDASGNLRVFTAGSVITVEGGSAGNVNFPCRPQMADMDGDGLKDIVVSDPAGYIWIYKNRGEKGNPKFTTGEFIPSYYGNCAKVWVGDFSGDGRNDMVVGVAYGHVIYVPNLGNPQKWQFTREMAKPRYCWPQYVQPGFEIPYLTMDKRPMLFGTYMSPTVYDWDNDGKNDLILGDGTYSANSVWLVRNVGSNRSPTFKEEEKYYLAYGKGREQLVPTVCDINGDNLPDLVVSDRQGYINLYLNKPDLPKEEQKMPFGTLRTVKKDNAPPILPFHSRIKCGGREQFPGPLSVAAADYNDDGMIDLLLGFPDGTMGVAINKGSKTEWKFDAVQNLRGTDTEKDFPSPAGWDYNYFGSVNSCFTVRALPEDKMPNGEIVKPQSGKQMLKFQYEHDYPGWLLYGHQYYTPTLSKYGWMIGGRMILTTTAKLTIGRKYEVSMYVRGSRITPIWGMWAHIPVRTARKNRATYEWYEVDSEIPGVTEANWKKFTKTFICPGPDKNIRIKPEDDTITFHFYIAFRGDGFCYVDDIQLNEVKGFGGLPPPAVPTPAAPPTPGR